MEQGESGEHVGYYPEKTNRPHGEALKGKTPDQNHMSNWIDCVRNRETPNAPVEIGYRSAVAVHMANLAYRRKQRITLEEAKSSRSEY
jgi:hypothetical protein